MKLKTIITILTAFFLTIAFSNTPQYPDTTLELTFTCVDEESNEALDLVLILLLDEEANIVLQTFTDEDGKFSAWVEKGYAYTIVTKSANHEPQSYYIETSEDAETFYSSTIKLKPSTTLTEVQ